VPNNKEASSEGGRHAAKTNQRRNPTLFAAMGRLSTHFLWHCKRNIFKTDCVHCLNSVTKDSKLVWTNGTFEEDKSE